MFKGTVKLAGLTPLIAMGTDQPNDTPADLSQTPSTFPLFADAADYSLAR